MTTNYDKLKALLRDLFQMDQADLDFGIYRIMNAKRDEIEKFLEHDLLPQVKAELAAHQPGFRCQAGRTRRGHRASQNLGMNPDTSPKVQELREELKHGGGDLDALENEVFSDLYNFFRRYYHEGDFLACAATRRASMPSPTKAKKSNCTGPTTTSTTSRAANTSGTTRSSWPTASGCISSSSRPTPRRTTTRPQPGRNVGSSCASRSAGGGGRRTVHPVRVPARRREAKQDELNTAAVAAVLGNDHGFDRLAAAAWRSRAHGEESASARCWRSTWTTTPPATPSTTSSTKTWAVSPAELDFFIKNEVMHLDDIEDETAPRVEQYLAKIKAIRMIAHKIIALPGATGELPEKALAEEEVRGGDELLRDARPGAGGALPGDRR